MFLIFPSTEQRELSPLPEAVDFLVTLLAQPGELLFDAEQPVGGVFFGWVAADGAQEFGVQARGGRGDMFEV